MIPLPSPHDRLLDGLFNRLLPIETGIVSSADAPYAIEGQRPW